jgi:hypothetical protein
VITLLAARELPLVQVVRRHGLKSPVSSYPIPHAIQLAVILFHRSMGSAGS